MIFNPFGYSLAITLTLAIANVTVTKPQTQDSNTELVKKEPVKKQVGEGDLKAALTSFEVPSEIAATMTKVFERPVLPKRWCEQVGDDVFCFNIQELPSNNKNNIRKLPLALERSRARLVSRLLRASVVVGYCRSNKLNDPAIVRSVVNGVRLENEIAGNIQKLVFRSKVIGNAIVSIAYAPLDSISLESNSVDHSNSINTIYRKAAFASALAVSYTHLTLPTTPYV